MTMIRRRLDELRRMRAEDQELLDRLSSSTPEGVDIEERRQSLDDLNFAAAVDEHVIEHLEQIAAMETTPAYRLGIVFNWAGIVFAVLISAFTAFIAANMVQASDSVFVSAVGGISAIVAYGAGRALRYICSGF